MYPKVTNLIKMEGSAVVTNTDAGYFFVIGSMHGKYQVFYEPQSQRRIVMRRKRLSTNHVYTTAPSTRTSQGKEHEKYYCLITVRLRSGSKPCVKGTQHY